MRYFPVYILFFFFLIDLKASENFFQLKDSSILLESIEYSYQLRTQKPDSSLILAFQNLYLSYDLNYTKGICRSEIIIGIHFQLKGEYEKARKYYEQALDRSLKINDLESTAKIYNLQGILFYIKGDYVNSLEHYFKAISIFQKLNNESKLSSCYLNIGVIYWQQDNILKALEYYEKSYAIKEKIKDESGLAIVSLNIGLSYLKIKKFEAAINYLNHALQIRENQKDLIGLSYVYASLVNAYIDTKDDKLAFEYIVKLEHLLDSSLLSKERIAHYKSLKAKYYNLKNEFNKALALGLESVQLAKEIQNLEYLKDASLEVSYAARGLKDFEKAFEYQKIYINLKDSIASQISKNRALNTEWEFLRLQNNLEHDQEIKKHKLLNLSLLTSLVVLLLSLLFFVILAKIRKDTNKNLQEKNLLIEEQKQKILDINTNLENLVIERTKSLQNKNTILNELAYMNSHKVRAPLARILGLIEIIKNDPSLLKSDEILNSILKTSQQLDEVIHEIQHKIEE